MEIIGKRFPNFDEEVKAYFKSILEDLTADREKVDDAFGNFLKEALPRCDRSEIDDICEKIYQELLKNEETKENSCTKLSKPVDMSIVGQEIKKTSTMGTVQTKEASVRAYNVDKKKLAKAEMKLRQKRNKKLKIDESAELNQFSTTQAGSSKVETSNSFDINIQDFDLSYGSRVLLKNASVSLASGRKYGIVGRNGYGKTTLLRAISSGDLSIPRHLSVLHVEQEVTADDTNIVTSVMNSHLESFELLKEEKNLNEKIKQLENKNEETTELHEQLAAIYTKLEEFGYSEFESTISTILFGLGFSSEAQKLPTKSFSGGWRMRLSLARALFLKPDLMLLDEPTNMLDLKAISWLQHYLESWPKTIVIVSHDKVFLDEIATDVIHLTNQKLVQYAGNYSTFMKTKSEKHLHQLREYESQKAYREHLQTFIDRFRVNANRAAQAQSKLKVLEKLPDLEPVEEEPPVIIKFFDVEKCSGSLIRLDAISFSYSSEKKILENVDLTASNGSKITIIGDNGTGKTTLLKILVGLLEPTTGFRNLNRNARIGYFCQHHIDQLVMSKSSLEILHDKYPNKTEGECRGHLSSFGLSGDLSTRPVMTLSGGQKSRVSLALIAMDRPNLLILDEPTNHLDIETVEALSKAIKVFKGGVILVSHNEYLIREATDELWLCRNGGVSIYKSGIDGYMNVLKHNRK